MRLKAPEKKGENKYCEMVNDKKGFLNVITEGKEAIITVKVYTNSTETTPEWFSQSCRTGEVEQKKSTKKSV